MKIVLTLVILFLRLFKSFCKVNNYPVDIPKGGRRDVHGWLVLPIDHSATINGSVSGVRAWFSHHVPEFFTDSPHNFQIILKGTLYPTSCVEGELYALDIPTPPANDLLNLEYSFTPPSPFSLNDLLSGSLKQLNGVYFIGSFDTSFERIPQSLSTLRIDQLTTATYLSEYEKNSYPNLRYLSYPRGSVEASTSQSEHFYLAHEIHAQPDFDHIVHGTIGQCNSGNHKLIYAPGASWEVIGLANTLENKLAPQKSYQLHLIQQVGNSSHDDDITCTLNVLEFIHCMIGPGFGENCY